ncbi:hypothetical protein G8O24_24735 [Bradyrhizobium sp. INPA01-394B]|uniref:Secreted protein n=1 Tax=Bradyrhizobium campsiandrae TaxID=1729892 RepID=A0ABR7UAB4_9BRAD|nr:hypothetical protein [Bradyrhizobium campsiandrae]MBC9880537.1 hypothetical protein [Bradyrhizobium campsiandrae]MBC9981020.1 hypothetical protein [Bradyrhizobium campsiandrae]
MVLCKIVALRLRGVGFLVGGFLFALPRRRGFGCAIRNVRNVLLSQLFNEKDDREARTPTSDFPKGADQSQRFAFDIGMSHRNREHTRKPQRRPLRPQCQKNPGERDLGKLWSQPR